MDDLPAKPSYADLVERYESHEVLRAVLRTTARRGPWEPPERMRAVSVLGTIVLDYRDADLPLGVTEVDCEVYLGNVEVLVPPDVDVELLGSVLLGSVEVREDGARRGWWRRVRARLSGREPEPDDDFERPLLSVRCSGVMGNVEIELGP